MFSLEGIDHGLLYGLNQGRQAWLSNLMIGLGQLSGNTSIAILTCALSLFCLIQRQFRIRGVIYPLAVVSGMAAVEGIKRFVERDRPNIVPWLVPEANVHGFSFPSGHATTNTLFGILLIGLFLRMNLSLTVRVALAFLTAVWVISIGFNRIYLGVHWPTDVLGGWCLGSLIGLAWLRLISLIEKPNQTPTHSSLPA